MQPGFIINNYIRYGRQTCVYPSQISNPRLPNHMSVDQSQLPHNYMDVLLMHNRPEVTLSPVTFVIHINMQGVANFIDIQKSKLRRTRV